MSALFGGGPSIPAPPVVPPPPPAATPPTFANPNVAQAGANQRTRAAAAAGAGFGGTVQNQGGPAGLVEPATTAPRTLLG